MTLQILINIMIAMVWMLLHDRWEAGTFGFGYAIGLMIVYSMRRFFPGPFYLRRLWAILKLLWLFLVELVKSTVVVVRLVLRPNMNIEPGIFKVKTKLTEDWEITMLCCLLTLTPGSVVMEVAPGEGVMYVHAVDATEFQKSIIQTKQLFEEAILEVTG